MEFKKFEKIINLLREQSDKEIKASEIGLDIFNFLDPYNAVIDLLMKEIYGEEGNEWFGWFCYENDFGRGNLTADDKGVLICYDIPSLYTYLNINHKK